MKSLHLQSLMLVAVIGTCVGRLRIKGRLQCGREREKHAPIKLYGQSEFDASKCQQMIAETQTKHNGVYDLVVSNVTFSQYSNYFLTVNYSCDAKSSGRMLWILFLPKDLPDHKLFFVGAWNLRVRPGPLTLNPDIVSECSEGDVHPVPKTKETTDKNNTKGAKGTKETKESPKKVGKREGPKSKKESSKNSNDTSADDYVQKT
ncbi:unnamed protein product [Soboliphyme baturini]|uniref:Uncharacterized protein n=1 Tax=Soboliphyme baturini TaxID=241478 RepID=A0A183IBH3_9BILA|nr:unnamed protein product [Soboliphyme baturini]